MIRKPGLLAVATIAAVGSSVLEAETYTFPFYSNFEPGWSFKDEWHAFDAPANRYTDCPTNWSKPYQDYCPRDPSNAPGIPAPPTGDSWTWGPYKFETWPDKDNGGRVFSGQRSGRQPIADPYWYAIYHIFEPPAAGKDLRLKAEFYDDAAILCDCDPWGPPSRSNFDVNAGIELGAPYRRADYVGTDKEYYFLGINSHQSWDHYAWATAADGWVVSNVPRTQGWHRLEIVVHPYSGRLDVEFWIDQVRVAEGHRMLGPSGTGAEVSYLHLGGDPALITESNLSNTFEDGWYDEVALTTCNNPRMDSDGDGDVDQVDFGYFQSCISEPADPFQLTNPSFDGAACQCADLDGDQDVDDADVAAFVDCISGPSIPADPDCDL